MYSNELSRRDVSFRYHDHVTWSGNRNNKPEKGCLGGQHCESAIDLTFSGITTVFGPCLTEFVVRYLVLINSPIACYGKIYQH